MLEETSRINRNQETLQSARRETGCSTAPPLIDEYQVLKIKIDIRKVQKTEIAVNTLKLIKHQGWPSSGGCNKVCRDDLIRFSSLPLMRHLRKGVLHFNGEGDIYIFNN